LLRAFGAHLRIVDRQLDRVHESRALAIQLPTLEVLRGLGITEALVEHGNDTVRLHIHLGSRVVRVRLFDVGLEDSAYPFLLFLSQSETEAIMNEHLARRRRPGRAGRRARRLRERSGPDHGDPAPPRREDRGECARNTWSA